MKIFSLQNYPIENKIVLLRVDYNVPIENGKITDLTKINNSLQTINYLLEKNCKIVLAFHLGRPEGKIVKTLKVDPIYQQLKTIFKNETIIKFNDCIGKEIKEKIKKAKKAKIFVLENLRFYHEEKENDSIFAHSLADLADIYVNDAFASCHREHASVSAITNFIPALAGFSLLKEIYYLNKAIKAEKPTIWIMGGAKLDKVDLIKQALKKADQILIGGALAFSFLKAKKINTGMSKIDLESVKVATEILKEKTAKKIILPIDFMVTEKFSPRTNAQIVEYNQIKNNQMALDIGPKTIKLFETQLIKAKTIIWNGPLGYFEWAKFAQGTKDIGRFLGKIKAIKIAGGGETAKAINKFYLTHNFSHVSTGGGASLVFLSGKKLPGLDALINNFKNFKNLKK